jgi:hypothetical protein
MWRPLAVWAISRRRIFTGTIDHSHTTILKNDDTQFIKKLLISPVCFHLHAKSRIRNPINESPRAEQSPDHRRLKIEK